MKEYFVDQIVTLVSKQTEQSNEIKAGTSLVDDLAMDSLQLCEMMALAEEAFDVEIPHTSIFLVDTIEEVGELILSLKKQNA